ncbi:hypothetical protein CP532_2216 [Ophiocordyceps camponoti-leonardi (nom. inval.)]|nr:hypothetical protein CP532_2216 [Ophiocordyceps camponoti-leonardi (nom. inval.)]
MTPQVLRLPDGQTFTVSPVFAGVGFISDQYKKTHHHSSYPVGWTAVVMTETSRGEGEAKNNTDGDDDDDDDDEEPHFEPFTRPSLSKDHIYISSVANPSQSEYKPAASPTRHMAMMLWVTLCWYFHQPEPPRTSADDEEGEWIVHVRPQGLLRGGNVLSKLEHMGLVAASDSSVCRGSGRGEKGGDETMFVHRRMFWQTPARLFLFTPEPILSSSPSSSSSHLPSPSPLSPFTSTSHLPTYYPPAPLPHITTNNIRHPLRPLAPRMGDVFYSRFIPSVGQYLSFRIASSSPSPVPYNGPIGPGPSPPNPAPRSDTSLLQAWHAIPRVSDFWGPFQPDYLPRLLADSHSFPAIGLWDGVPFGYFELYWAKEDLLGRHAPDDVADWDRGIHVMIGEEWARGRVAAWMTSLVHWCFIADLRTMTVCLEPRVDNARMLYHLEALGFIKEKIVTLPHKQSWYVTLRRESWQGPSL